MLSFKQFISESLPEEDLKAIYNLRKSGNLSVTAIADKMGYHHETIERYADSEQSKKRLDYIAHKPTKRGRVLRKLNDQEKQRILRAKKLGATQRAITTKFNVDHKILKREIPGVDFRSQEKAKRNPELVQKVLNDKGSDSYAKIAKKHGVTRGQVAGIIRDHKLKTPNQ